MKEANMTIPTIATIPATKTDPGHQGQPPGYPAPKPNGPVDLSHVSEADIYHQAAVRAMEHESYKEKSKQLIQEAGDHIKTLAREIEFLKLEIAEKSNTVQVQQAEMSDLRQENSDLRAVLSEYLAQFKYMVARLEQKEIQPLPPRNHKKKKTEESLPPVTFSTGSVTELAEKLQAVEPKKDDDVKQTTHLTEKAEGQ